LANLLKTGSRGADVKVLQKILNAIIKPIPRLVEDGAFGKKTKDVLKVFQSQKQLSSDGIAGTKTQSALGMNQASVVQQASNPGASNAALASACKVGPEITSAPLWHMGLVAKFGSASSFKLLQDTIDYLTCKAKAGEAFTEDEKEFLVELYESFWWGGRYKGFHEAAVLANHYVNGNGATVKIDSFVYKNAVIVRDTQTAMKAYIATQLNSSTPTLSLKSTDPRLLQQSDFQKLLRNRGRSAKTQGYLVDKGVLMAEQLNSRLKNADHRFVLKSTSRLLSPDSVATEWRVDSKYDFEPFASAKYFTVLPLKTDMDLHLPDGLSHYMTKIGIAADFNYFSVWNESWAK